MGLKRAVVLGGLVLITAFTTVACSEKEVKKSDSNVPQAVSQAAVSGSSVDVQGAKTLKDAYQNDFSIGVATTSGYLSDSERADFVCNEFNSVTTENEMKPESLLDWKASEQSKDGMPEINTDTLDKALKAAKDCGIKLRGHCLVWHSQTPDWFFSKEFDPEKGLVDKETMQKRMESYIKKVLTFAKENYPGVVYAWDVVNESMGDDGYYRTESKWYETYGDESYIIDAFTFARKYASSDMKLFLNDYNEYTPDKRDLLLDLIKQLNEKGLIDGFGMQSHWDMEYPSVSLFEQALEKYGAIDGLEIQLTEVDMHNTDDSEEGLKTQAERYKEFFETILKYDRSGKANVTNVTFWGLLDDESWLSGFKGETSYPLLFNGNLEKKPCYNSILEAAKETYK